MNRRRRTRLGLAALVSLTVTLVGVPAVAGAVPTAGTGHVDWPAYQAGPAHGSLSPATAITPAKVGTLPLAWSWRPDPPTMSGQPSGITASPTVVGGVIYIGAGTGWFYKLSLTTGKVLGKRFLGFTPARTCISEGIVSTATVAVDPISHTQVAYVAAPDGRLYGMRTSDLSDVFPPSPIVKISPVQNDYFLWSSPTLSHGRIYLGISSQCDAPLVRAGVVAVNPHTGAVLARYYTMPAGAVGGSVWSSVAVDTNGSVFATTGNPNSESTPGNSNSIVRLDGTTLALLDHWRVPAAQTTTDSDFGASPVLYSATVGGVSTPLVAACDKNGVLYSLRRTNLAAGPVWSTRVSIAAPDRNGCIGSPTYDGQRIYQAAGDTTVGTASTPGSIRAIDPATGTILWAHALVGTDINTATVDAAGVLVTATLTFASSTNQVIMLNTANGSTLRTVSVPTGMFGQAVFADRMLLLPTLGNSLQAFGPAP